MRQQNPTTERPTHRMPLRALAYLSALFLVGLAGAGSAAAQLPALPAVPDAEIPETPSISADADADAKTPAGSGSASAHADESGAQVCADAAASDPEELIALPALPAEAPELPKADLSAQSQLCAGADVPDADKTLAEAEGTVGNATAQAEAQADAGGKVQQAFDKVKGGFKATLNAVVSIF